MMKSVYHILTALTLAVSANAQTGAPYIHDPSTIAECEGKYYTFGTGGGGLISEDGWNWHSGAERPGGGAAPDVLKIGDRYLCIYGATGGGLGGGHNGRILTMWNKTLDPKSPDFKWTTPVEVCSSDGMEDQDAIDPGLLLDPTTGRLWVSYGTYFGTIRLIELDPTTGERMKGNKEKDIAIDCEATDLLYRDGWYYLLGTHGTCCDGVNSTYNIVVGRSRSVEGPYMDNVGRDMFHGGGRMVIAAGDRKTGPGHFGRTIVDEGVEVMSCHFEADFDRSGRSVLGILPLLWKNGWPVAGERLKEGTFAILSERRGYSLELGVDFVRMEQERQRFWQMDPNEPVKAIPNQKLEDVIGTWPEGEIAVRCSNYMFRPWQHWHIKPVPQAGGRLTGPLYEIYIEGTNRALTATADLQVSAKAFEGQDSQLWWIEQLTDGTYRIMPFAIPGQEGNNKEYCLYSAGDSTPTLAKYDFQSDNSKWNFKQQPQNTLSVIQNPMLWADVPDPDIIRVDDTFYLVSTTMHLMPGAPIMQSKDLKNWETVGYIFDRLTDSPKYDLQQGSVYGRGQWATSLKYHNGKFYALLAPNEAGAMGDTYIFSAEKARGPWTLVSRMRHFHDCSLFFDDDDRVYVIYGTGEMMELKPDLSDVIEGTHQQIFQREEDETGLLEGSRMIKHNGKYYLLMISHVWAPGRHRREVCYRADDIHGPYEKQVILESEFGGFPYEAQGTIVDTQDGDWYGIIFQDRGGVGRVLTVMPCRWINGWPMLGDENGKVPETVRPVVCGQPETHIVKSDDFADPTLGLHWQWNHNPIDDAWSLTERPGYLRLKTNRIVTNLYEAPNTLTQRMEGPTCSGAIVMDLSKMQDGDCAGLAAFNGDAGVLTVKKSGKRLTLSMTEQSVSLTEREKQVTDVKTKEIESMPLTTSKIWLRVDGDFRPNGHGGGQDLATFYYSLDGEQWTKIGSDYRMIFDYRRFFMGTKFGIFCYATKKKGGYVDIDNFEYTKK